MAKILLCSEFTKFKTGYSKYYRKLAEGFTAAGHEVIELASKGDANHPDHIRYSDSVDWKIYFVEPSNNDKLKTKMYNERQKTHGDATHGGWLYDLILKEEKPDIVISLRDYWYDEFIISSPLSKNTNVILCPTVDSFPQKPEWIEGFNKADHLVFYNKWSENWWRQQSSSDNVYGTISPASNNLKCKPKIELREKFNIDNDVKIAITVMRNQTRKRFPELLDAIKQTDWSIHLHTSFPDGRCWNLPELIKQAGCHKKVFFTYLCSSCDNLSIENYSGTVSTCLKCKNKKEIPSNHKPITEDQLNDLYCNSDLYIQYHNSEGFGLPTMEAGSCGIQTSTIKFSGQESVGENVGSIFLEPLELQRDYTNNCFRAIPDNIELVKLLSEFDVNYDREAISKKVKEFYNWQKTTDQWLKLINSIETKVPTASMLNTPVSFESIKNLNNSDFVYYCCKFVAQDRKLWGSIMSCSILESLNNGFKYIQRSTGFQKIPYNKENGYQEFEKIFQEHYKQASEN